MFVVTGGAGFIGSAFLAMLNIEGISDIIVVDEIKQTESWKNLRGKRFAEFVDKNEFRQFICADKDPQKTWGKKLTAIVHMGACSSTTETDVDYLLDNNYRYSVVLAEYAAKHGIRFIYASSAATYGDGRAGFSDTLFPWQLTPLNAYGFSKNIFDQYMLRNYFGNGLGAVGLKFFNVFGPNEYHKAGMLSGVFRSWKNIVEHGEVRLFKSYRADIKDGQQKRDFVYVKDCCEVIWWLLNKPEVSGIFNLGSGIASTWNDLAGAVFLALKLKPKITYVEMPGNLIDQYQYYTCAEMQRLRDAGCPVKFHSLQEAVHDYVVNYLQCGPGYI